MLCHRENQKTLYFVPLVQIESRQMKVCSVHSFSFHCEEFCQDCAKNLGLLLCDQSKKDSLTLHSCREKKEKEFVALYDSTTTFFAPNV